MPQKKPGQTDFGDGGDGGANDTEDFEQEKLPPLVKKEKLVGKVLLVESWRERTGENGEYLVFRGRAFPDYKKALTGLGGAEVAFSSGTVLVDQVKDRMGPFRAKLQKVEPDEGRAYWTFVSPK